MRVVEKYYTVQEAAWLIGLCTKTVIAKLKLKEFGEDVLNLGTAARPDYRLPASGLNGFIEARRIFYISPESLGVPARSEGELRRKATVQTPR